MHCAAVCETSFEIHTRARIRVKKDTKAKERAVNAITDELVCTACCRLVNYYNCEVPAIFRLALVHQPYIYIPTYRPADTAQRSSIHRRPASNQPYSRKPYLTLASFNFSFAFISTFPQRTIPILYRSCVNHRNIISL